MKAQRWRRGIDLFFSITSELVNAMPLQLYLWERDLAPLIQEAGWALGLVWMGTENFAHAGSNPIRPKPY